jgi:pseudouridine synthase
MKKILQKIIAESGYCSRHAAEAAIKRGQVKVNGLTAKVGDLADEQDKITVSRHPIGQPQSKIYLKLNKPIGYTCTNRKFPGENNIFELLPRLPRNLFTIGRLDKNSHGLILISNDGDLSLKLTHPSKQHEKIYRVRIRKDLSDKQINQIKRTFEHGILFSSEEGTAKAKRVDYLGDGCFEIVLGEGKKRELRRMFEALDFKVIDLKRINFAGLELGHLPEGHWQYLTPTEIKGLKDL